MNTWRRTPAGVLIPTPAKPASYYGTREALHLYSTGKPAKCPPEIKAQLKQLRDEAAQRAGLK